MKNWKDIDFWEMECVKISEREEIKRLQEQDAEYDYLRDQEKDICACGNQITEEGIEVCRECR